MPTIPRILVIDHDRNTQRLVCQLLRKNGGFSVLTSTSFAEAKAILAEHPISIVLAEQHLPDSDDHNLLNFVRDEYPDIAVIIMSSSGPAEAAKTIHTAAMDYIAKPFHAAAMLLTVKRALETVRLRKQLNHLQSTVEERYCFEKIIGKSKAMQSVFETIRRISTSNVNVVITGASGTGKELVARAIHYRSARKDRPFVPVECAAIPDTLLEAELFGYMKGAFTDAKTNKAGLMFEASGGTLFLDEVSEFPLALQAKLLRAIQEGEIRPLGSTKTIIVDLRIIAATNVDLSKLVSEHRFRGDLFYRLNVMNICLPPLIERKEDITMLVDHFIKHFSDKVGKEVMGIEKDALRLLLNYDWPGNIRELENSIERAIALTREDTIQVEDLPDNIRRPGENGDLLEIFGAPVTLKDLEYRYIKTLLGRFGGNKAKVARVLGIDRKTLYNKLSSGSLSEHSTKAKISMAPPQQGR